MRTLTLTLRDVDENGETFSSSVKVEVKGGHISSLLMSAYLKANADIEKYIMQKEIADQEYLLRKR